MSSRAGGRRERRMGSGRMALRRSACCLLLSCLAAEAMASAPEAEPGMAEGTRVESALDRRIRIEQRTRYESFVLTPHKPNYLMPWSYNDLPVNAPSEFGGPGGTDRIEIKFQLSVKFSIAEDIFTEHDSLQFAYTNLSFWQAYNDSVSSPFRETVHEPELFMIFRNDWEVMGFRNRLVQAGLVHQSNGRSGVDSRSWNRFYVDFIFQRGDFYLSLRPWYRLGEPGTDDNPDIEKFLGHGEVRGVWTWNAHTLSIMLRNNLRAENYGAVELNWSFPMSRRVRWFVQYFNGYGESMIDYNVRVERLGLGVALTDWL